MTDKPFLSIEQQVAQLESRGMSLTQPASSELLRREGYYPLVNGYKEELIAGGGGDSGVGTIEDSYPSHADLAHLGALLRFDRSLRGALITGLSECEALLREVTVRAFCSEHRGSYDYLDLQHYSDGYDRKWLQGHKRMRYIKGRDRLVAKTLRNIGRPDSPEEALRRDYQPLQHYRNKHDVVPLWIAALPLTFGEVCTLYSAQKREVRTRVCEELEDLYHASWGAGANVFHDEEVDSIYSFLRKLRNVCAHDERCYCVQLRARGQLGVSEIASRMRYFMRQDTYAEMEFEIDRALGSLCERVPTSVHKKVEVQVRPVAL